MFVVLSDQHKIFKTRYLLERDFWMPISDSIPLPCTVEYGLFCYFFCNNE